MSTKKLFNEGWEFSKQPIGTGLEEMSKKGVVFEPIDIPHDWLIYNTKDLYEDSVGWYRKKFLVTSKEGERRSLRFEGVYMNSTVYINNQEVGQWKYGYSTFEFDITDYLVDGENEVKVMVIHQSPNSRWYSGAGIYRNVWLTTTQSTYLVSDGIYIVPRKEEDGWKIEVETEVVCKQEATLRHTILEKVKQEADEEGVVNWQVVEQVIARGSGQLTRDCKVQLDTQHLIIEAPKLWDIEEVHLYVLRTEILVNDTIIDQREQTFGFRTIDFNSNEGFFLNGRRIKLNGVCEHHDLGALGAAFNKEAMRRKFKILLEMGVNAVRTTHNMPAVELMELADEMGILIVSEAFDMWERSKTTYDYARFFKEWYSKDIASWVRRDRNHPSVIMWSIGNEIYDTHVDERGQVITRELMKEVLKHDPKGNAKVTIGSNYMPWENAQKCADYVKLAGYNYSEKYYEKHHEAYPDWVIYGSETSSTVQSRGIYHFPYAKALLADDDEQCSSLGNSTTSWGATSSEACIIAERDTDFSMGQFLWTGFDYIGEPTPYHTKNSYFGQIDTAGFPKDSYYIYQAAWTDYKKAPMIHILPYWDFNEGQMIDVRVCSNAPHIELLLNNQQIGTYDIDHKKGTQLLGHWLIPYESGELKAIAYDEAGHIVATDTKRSFTDPTQIILKPNKTVLRADGKDLIFLEISMVDIKGNVVENANNRVTVEVSGAGRLVGLDNGDSTDIDQYKGISRRLFSGKLLAIIAAKLIEGEIEVCVSSYGLPANHIILMAKTHDKMSSGISVFMENKQMSRVNGNLEVEEEIPVRKIELISKQGNELNENLKEIEVTARLYPKQATDQKLIWSVVDDAGIPSYIANVRTQGDTAYVSAKGDGKFRLRCMSQNGTDCIRIISQMEFTVTGLGEAYLNPYAFISGGLYSFSKGTVSNGNERGVATARDSETCVGYTEIDFGKYGSDEITIPIFALSDETYYLQIWEGVPGEVGSYNLADVVYQKPSIWNVYQEETYKLSKRLKGITSIYFVLNQKIHIKGFSFKRLNKAFEKLLASENDGIYGDAYSITENGIENIGNNVTLVFEDLDFGEKGMSHLTICGNSPIEVNSIHVRFISEEGESKQLVEFNHSEGDLERRFVLERVTGKQKVSFVFLPGSKFDFKWFQFEE